MSRADFSGNPDNSGVTPDLGGGDGLGAYLQERILRRKKRRKRSEVYVSCNLTSTRDRSRDPKVGGSISSRGEFMTEGQLFFFNILFRQFQQVA